MTSIIEIQDLKKHFGSNHAVDGLSMSIPAGRVTAFLGPNGAGKTTTIKCMLNLHQPDGGSIKLIGQDSTKLGPSAFQQIGYVSENQELPLWMKVSEYVDYCRPLYPSWDVSFEKKLLKDFDLPQKTTLRDLSRGMRMKAALLSSLAYRPKLIVLDEPFSGLDPLVRDEFIHGLLELTEQEGWTVFISSHDIEEVERLADDVAIIDRGKLPLHETTDTLTSRFRRIETSSEEETLPVNLPGSWLDIQQSGRVIRFTESRYDDGEFKQKFESTFPGAPSPSTSPMSLREIFVTLAKTFRLNTDLS